MIFVDLQLICNFVGIFMRILQINKFHFPKGGADKHFLDLVKLLESKGHKVAEFCMLHSQNTKSEWSKYFVSTAGYTDEYNPWQKIKGVFRMFYSFEARKKINWILDDFQPDIVHIHNIYHQLSPVILFEIKKRKIPIVMTVHDYKLINPNYNLYHNGKFYNRGKSGKYYQCFLDKCVKNSYFKSFIAMLEMYWHNEILRTYKKNIDLYIVPSLFARNILSEGGVDGRKIAILPHFINKSEQTRTTLLYNNVAGVRYGFYFGRISKEKGVDELIKIFNEISGAKLYLAGALENNFEIKKSGNINYLGHLNQNQLTPCIRNARFIISGSRLPETFGLVALEAISQGKPFIGFRAGAYGEIIENGANGMLAENKEELKGMVIKLLKGKWQFDEEKIQTLAFQKYSSDNYEKNLAGLFSEVIQSGKAALFDKNRFSC